MWYVVLPSQGVVDTRTHFRQARTEALKMFATDAIPRRLQIGFYSYGPKHEDGREHVYIFHDTLAEELGYGEVVRQWKQLGSGRSLSINPKRMMRTPQCGRS